MVWQNGWATTVKYIAPTKEQSFALETCAGVSQLAQTSRFSEATPDLVDAILQGAGDFAKDVWLPLSAEGDQNPPKHNAHSVTMPSGFPAAYREYVDCGWGTLAAPVEFGGQGLPMSLGVAALESLGSANFALALCPILTQGAIEAIEAHASPELKEAYLPKLVTGEWTGTMNLTEPQAGSDVGGLKATAQPNTDGSWSITGTKIFISYGDHDLAENIIHLVLARTPGSPSGTKGISLFLVPKLLPDDSANDLICSSIEHKMGLHASPTCVMSFGDNGGAKGWMIGEENAGMRAMFTMMNSARLNVAMQGVQIAERSTQEAILYAQDRVQAGLIIAHPDVRRMILRMKALTQGARALAYFAFGNLDHAEIGTSQAKARADILTPLAKTWCTDIGSEVTSLGIQVHGGMGYVEETGVAQHYRDARITAIYEGTNGIQAADFVGRKLAFDGGERVNALLNDLLATAHDETLINLLKTAKRCVAWMANADVQDRLAGSYAMTTMSAISVAGALLERQMIEAQNRLDNDGESLVFYRSKIATCRFFLQQIVPEAIALEGPVCCGAHILNTVTDEELAS